MTGLIAQATVKGPPIDWEALSPFISLTAGACVVLLVGLARSSFVRATRSQLKSSSPITSASRSRPKSACR